MRNSIEMMALKHIVVVKSRSIAVGFWEIRAFEEIKKRVSETSLVVVLNIGDCLFLC